MALEVLADRLGIKKDSTLKKRIMGMMRSGEISSGAAINAILEATQRTCDKGENGKLNPSEPSRGRRARAWEGLISNIRNGLSDVLTMKLPEGHPMLVQGHPQGTQQPSLMSKRSGDSGFRT